MDEPNEFGIEFELRLLTNLYLNQDFFEQCSVHLRAEFFRASVWPKLYQVLDDYVGRFKSLPNLAVVESELRGFIVLPEEKPFLDRFCSAIQSNDCGDLDYIRSKFLAFAENQTLKSILNTDDLTSLALLGKKLTEASQQFECGSSLWSGAKSAVEVCQEQEDVSVPYYVEDLVVPSCLTLIAAPRGIGKSLLLNALAVKLESGAEIRGEATKPLRIMLVDRDNPPRIVKERIRSWGGEGSQNIKILRRDEAPDLKDKKAWQSFPVKDHDVLMLDSVATFTEGITEKEGKETSLVLATLLDLAHQGPAVLALANCTKDALTIKGRGDWSDRADIVYEVRDATGFTPSGKKPWWLELPPASESDWADRATRRRSRTDYRLAFFASKFRIGQQPEPFCIEINLFGPQWTITDVTDSLVAIGKKFEQENAQTENHGLAMLAAAVHKAHGEDKPMTKTGAENYLRDYLKDQITQKRARFLIE
jgi:hypothetical protein